MGSCRYGIVNQLCIYLSLASAKSFFFVFLERLLVSWFSFRRNKTDIKSDGGYSLISIVRRDRIT